GDEHLDGICLLRWVVPIDVEAALGTAGRERRSPKLGRERGGFETSEPCRATQQLARRVAEQIDRVLDSGRANKGPRVDGKTHGLRQLLEIKALRTLRQLDRTLEESTVHVVRDEALAKGTQGPLGERGDIRSEDAQNDLPPRIHDAELDRLSIRRSRVRLKQHDHGQQSWRNRSLALAAVPVHSRELILECLVKKLEPLLSKEREQLLRTAQPLQKQLFALARLALRGPTRNGHGRLWRPLRRRRRTSADHTRTSVSRGLVSDRNDPGFEPIGALA